MTYSSLTTETYSTSQSSTRSSGIDHIVLHHAATVSMDQVIGMMVSGSREVSANYVVKDGRIASVVPEERRSWSLSSASWDSRSITFEIANESAGGAWPVSSASHESVARVVADLCRRYGIPCNRDRILGHREVYSRYGASYATACPGGLDMDWIVARALVLLNPVPIPMKGTNMPAMIGTPKAGGGFRFILTDGVRKLAVTEDQTLANRWTFAYCGGVLPVATNLGTPTEQAMKLDAFKWLDAQPIDSPSGVELDEAALAAELAKILPTGATKAELDAAVKSIKAAIPTKLTV